jgi:uncharacterized protein (UPF0276 family)
MHNHSDTEWPGQSHTEELTLDEAERVCRSAFPWKGGPVLAPSTSSARTIPGRAGLGLKPEHYRIILDTRPDIGFFEVHAENYMGSGGPPHRYLAAIADLYPLSLHGVGLSIGGSRPLDKSHLLRLKELVRKYNPALFSEHLAWSTHDSGFFNDLLPLPYTADTLRHVCEHIDEIQFELTRQMLLENPSTYVQFSDSTYSEVDFIAEVVKRTGCGLLLDLNNVYVASTNQQWEPTKYLDSFPLSEVQEIHLAGHTKESDEHGHPLLIDTHDCPVSEIVWALFERVIRTTGPLPTLIEWDAALPRWTILRGEAQQADSVMREVMQEAAIYAANR